MRSCGRAAGDFVGWELFRIMKGRSACSDWIITAVLLVRRVRWRDFACGIIAETICRHAERRSPMRAIFFAAASRGVLMKLDLAEPCAWAWSRSLRISLWTC